jgi:hypothetical protein
MKSSNRTPKQPHALDVIFLSFRQAFSRMQVWIRPNFWMVLLSIPVLTAPAAAAGLFQAVRGRLLDPGDSRSSLRQDFRSGFFRFLGYSLALGVTNLLILAVILFSILFWTRQQERIFNYISIISFYFLAMWWLCQPFLIPAMIENPGRSIPRLLGHVIRLVSRSPLFALLITFTNTFLSVVGLVLLGPVLLIIPALVSLISLQSYWLLTGREIPDWLDPLQYENKLQQAEKSLPDHHPEIPARRLAKEKE